jgi:HK97 family phage prohead protease
MQHSNQALELKKMSVSYTPSDFKTDADGYRFKGYLSTFNNVDLGDDVVLPGAFADSLAQRKPRHLYQHDSARPVGVFTTLREDEKGLYVEGLLAKGNRDAEDLAALLKIGAIDSMSIGYSLPDKDSFELRDGIRYLKKIDLWEGSWVTFPMNPLALAGLKAAVPFQNLPLAAEDYQWDAQDATARVRAWSGSVEKPSESYKTAFLWFDAQKADDFSAYRLPIADIIGGKLTAVPRAIFAAAAVLRGARGGTDIPPQDQEKIKEHLERYYEKMGMESPFAKWLDIAEVESMKEVNAFLKQAGLSSRERDGLVAKIKQLSRAEGAQYCPEQGKREHPELDEAIRALRENLSPEKLNLE